MSASISGGTATALLLLATILAIPTVAAVAVHAEFQADGLIAQGAIITDSELTALLHPLASSQGAGLPEFQVVADALRVEMDHAALAFVVPGVANYQPMPETIIKHHDDAVLSGRQIADGFRFDVAPLRAGSAVVSVSSACAAQTPSEHGMVQRVPIVQWDEQRPDTVIDARQATQWEACDRDAVATVTGDFWFSAWFINLEVQDAEGTHAYWSGHRDEQPVTQDQELYVYVTNGTLQIPLGLATDYALFMGPGGTMDVSGAVQLHNAHGRLTSPTAQWELGGDSMTLDGKLQLGLQRSGDALQVALTGDSNGAIVNGQSLLMAATVPESVDASAWWWGLLAFPGLAAFVVQRRFRANLSYARAKRWTRQRPSDAIHQLNRAIQLRPHWGQAYYQRAYILTRLGKLQEALSDHEAAQQHLDLTDTLRRERNVREAYRTCAQLRDVEGIQHWQNRFQFKLPRYS